MATLSIGCASESSHGMNLVFGHEAAKALGVSPWFISSMKRAGAPFWGYKTDVHELEKWLRANPGFIARRQWSAPELNHSTALPRPRRHLRRMSVAVEEKTSALSPCVSEIAAPALRRPAATKDQRPRRSTHP